MSKSPSGFGQLAVPPHQAKDIAGLNGGYITGSSLAADGGMAIMLRPNPPPENPVYPPPF